ncbi:MAG: hypothetical protein WCC38_12540 [Pseudonocardiaceae bacterium]
MADWPEPGELVYLERRGDNYTMRRIGADGALPLPAPDESLPDAWIYYGGWPTHDQHSESAVVDDLLAEMEAAAGGEDRCRWSADDPWPHAH